MFKVLAGNLKVGKPRLC